MRQILQQMGGAGQKLRLQDMNRCVCVYVCLCMCALKGCFYEGKGWELSVWPSRCVRRWLLGLVRPSAEVAT